MVDKTNLDGQRLEATLDQFAEVGLHRRENRLEETPTKKWKLLQVGMNFIAPMLLSLFQMMCRLRMR
jgi:hypothetical protein